VDWTYREFIAQEQAMLGNLTAQVYFKTMLKDAPAEQIPRSKSIGTERVLERMKVDPFRALSGQLLALAKRLGVPVQSMLLAGHFKVLSMMKGQKRVVSCVTQTTRPETAGAERSLGMYLNSLPLSIEVRPGSWRDLIEQAVSVSTSAIQYRSYPLFQIQRDVGINLNEISFNYTHFHGYRELMDFAGKQLEVLNSNGFEQGGFDLLVDVPRAMNDDAMEMSLIYSAQVFDRTTIEQMSVYYVNVFEQMLQRLDQPHYLQSPSQLAGQVLEAKAKTALSADPKHEVGADEMEVTI